MRPMRRYLKIQKTISRNDLWDILQTSSLDQHRVFENILKYLDEHGFVDGQCAKIKCVVLRKSACPYGQVQTKMYLPESPFFKNSLDGASGQELMSDPTNFTTRTTKLYKTYTYFLTPEYLPYCGPALPRVSQVALGGEKDGGLDGRVAWRPE